MSIDLREIKSKIPKKSGKSPGTQIYTLSWLRKEVDIFNKGLSDKSKERLYSELTTLFGSGLDIRTSLEIIIQDQSRKREKELFQSVLNSIVLGENLSEALQKTKKFSPYEYFSIRIGEEAGKLSNVLSDLVLYYSSKVKNKRQIIGSLSYPIMVLVTAILAVAFMMNYIVPMFTDVFKRFNGELPGITRAIIRLSEVIRQDSGLIFVIVLIIIIAGVIFKKKEKFRKASSFIAIRIPFIGNIIKKTYQVRYCQAMTLLFSAKVPLVQAIRQVQQMIRFYPLEIALINIEKQIMQGQSLNDSMKAYSIFDKRLITLTKVGEEVNQLERVYSKLSLQYSDELEHSIKVLNNLLEPFLIIFVGGIVATILIAMYLPMFQISTAIG